MTALHFHSSCSGWACSLARAGWVRSALDAGGCALDNGISVKPMMSRIWRRCVDAWIHCVDGKISCLRNSSRPACGSRWLLKLQLQLAPTPLRVYHIEQFPGGEQPAGPEQAFGVGHTQEQRPPRNGQ